MLREPGRGTLLKCALENVTPSEARGLGLGLQEAKERPRTRFLASLGMTVFG